MSPGYSAAVDRESRLLDVLYIPGLATATEVQTALDAGRDVVKLFPAAVVGGAAMIAALSGPFPSARFVPTGGIGPAELGDYLRLPSVLAVGGTWLAPPAVVESGDFARVEQGHPRGDRDGGAAAMTLDLRAPEECAYDAVSLGEVMLRLDPGEGRIRTAREFRVWEGGGEYNVARGLARCFGLRTAIVTSLVDNEVGHLVEGLVLAGGVDASRITWVVGDAAGRDVRNGLNFTERGFGVRGAKGVSDRGHSAASQMRPEDTDWEHLFGTLGVRWFHTGGIFAGLSAGTADVVVAAMEAARRHGTVVSYDLNYRPSLWDSVGGPARAQEVNTRIAGLVDVLVGNEEDFTAALGHAVEGGVRGPDRAPPGGVRLDARRRRPQPASAAGGGGDPAERAHRDPERLGRARLVTGRTASCRPPSATTWRSSTGSGVATASRPGSLYGLLTGRDLHTALEYGAAHGALAMTTPGDTSMATLAEVEALVRGASARVQR